MSAPLTSLCVFCGSNPGKNPRFAEAAREFGVLLASEGITLVYGGGRVGLMGEIADSVMRHGGRAIGVIPHSLMLKEVAHSGLSELHVVDSMHERKAKMADLSDGFVAMPGGLGTLEEIFEVLTWGLLGIHRKPSGFLNIDGYYDLLLGFLENASREGLLRSEHLNMVLVERDHQRLIESLRNYASPISERWITRDER